jgi:5-methylcytosine-specific restriction endonuclease McrA
LLLKRCAVCKLPKPLYAFNKDVSKPDGLESRCKLCDRAKVAKWTQENPDKAAAKGARRRAEQLERRPKWIKDFFKDQVDEFYTMAKELEKIFPWKMHVDHIVPMKGKKVSGLEVPWNLQILSAKANLEKGNKHADEEHASPLPEGHYHNGQVHTQFGLVPTTWTGKDGNNADNHSGTVQGKDSNNRAKKSGRNSVGHGTIEVGTLVQLDLFEDYGEPDAEIIRLDFSRRHLSD